MGLKAIGLNPKFKVVFMNDKLHEDINLILSNWNPLEVPMDIAKEEYKSYINCVLKAGTAYEAIKAELIKILTSDLGLNYDENDVYQRNDVEKVATEVLRTVLEKG